MRVELYGACTVTLAPTSTVTSAPMSTATSVHFCLLRSAIVRLDRVEEGGVKGGREQEVGKAKKAHLCNLDLLEGLA